MGQTVEQIAAHIDSTRHQLGSNLQELERKVDAATDWREHYRGRPFTVLAVAFAGGAVLAALGSGNPRRPERLSATSASRAESHAGTEAQTHHALEVLDNIKGALIGLAAVRLKEYVSELVPGFDEQFQLSERRAASFHTTAKS